ARCSHRASRPVRVVPRIFRHGTPRGSWRNAATNGTTSNQAARSRLTSGETTMSKAESGGFPPQRQATQPGDEHRMHPEPEIIREGYIGSQRLASKHCVITGGDSGIGRAVAVHFAAEGAASVAIVYRDERRDAEKTKELVEERGASCLLLEGDVKDPDFPRRAIDDAAAAAGGRIDVLVNNAAVQWPRSEIEDITLEQIERTFRTNIYAYFLFIQAALRHMPE